MNSSRVALAVCCSAFVAVTTASAQLNPDVRLRLQTMQGRAVRSLQIRNQFGHESSPADSSGIVILPVPRAFESGELHLAIHGNEDWAILSPFNGRISVSIESKVIETVTVVRRGDLKVLENQNLLWLFASEVVSELEEGEARTVERALNSFTEKLALDKELVASVLNPDAFTRELGRQKMLLESLSHADAASLQEAAEFLDLTQNELRTTRSFVAPVIDRLLAIAFDYSQHSETAIAILEDLAPGAIGTHLANIVIDDATNEWPGFEISEYSGMNDERRTFSHRVLDHAVRGDENARHFIVTSPKVIAPALDHRGRINLQELFLSMAESTDTPRPLRIKALRHLRFFVENPWVGRANVGTFNAVIEVLVSIARESIGAVRGAAFASLVSHAMVLDSSRWNLSYDVVLDSVKSIYASSSLAEKIEMTAPLCEWLNLRDQRNPLRKDEEVLLHALLSGGALIGQDDDRCLPALVAHAAYLRADDLPVNAPSQAPQWDRRFVWDDLLPFMLTDADPAVRSRGHDVVRELIKRAESADELPNHPAVLAYLARSKNDYKILRRLARKEGTSLLGIGFGDLIEILARDIEVPTIVDTHGKSVNELRAILQLIHDATVCLWSSDQQRVADASARVFDWPRILAVRGHPEVNLWLEDLRTLVYAKEILTRVDLQPTLVYEAIENNVRLRSSRFALPILRSLEFRLTQRGSSEIEPIPRPHAIIVSRDVISPLLASLGYDIREGSYSRQEIAAFLGDDSSPCISSDGGPDRGPSRATLLRSVARIMSDTATVDRAMVVTEAQGTCFIPGPSDIQAAQEILAQELGDGPAAANLWHFILDDTDCRDGPTVTRALLRQVGRAPDSELIEKLSFCDPVDEVIASIIATLGQSDAADIVERIPENLTRRSAVNASRLAASRMAAYADKQSTLRSAAAVLSRIGTWMNPTDAVDWPIQSSDHALVLFEKTDEVVADFVRQMTKYDERTSIQAAAAWPRFSRATTIVSMLGSGTDKTACTLEPDELVVMDNSSWKQEGTFTRPVLAQVMWYRALANSNSDTAHVPGLGNCGQGGLYSSGQFSQEWHGVCAPIWSEVARLQESPDECTQKFSWILTYHSLLHRDRPADEVGQAIQKRLESVRDHPTYNGSEQWKRLFSTIDEELRRIPANRERDNLDANEEAH